MMADRFERCCELAGYGLLMILGAIAAVAVVPLMVLGWIGYRLGWID
jgi:hypothetical protein